MAESMIEAAAPAAAGSTKPPRRKKGRPVVLSLAIAIVVPIVLVVGWWFISADSDNPFFPSLENILKQFQPTWIEVRGSGRRIQTEVLPSVYRLLVGYGLALVFGIVLGMLIGSSRRLRAFLEPTLEFFRAIPPPVLVPVLMLFLGIRDPMKIFVIAMGCAWPILLNTAEGVRGVDEVLRDTARVYRMRWHKRITTLLLRGASPQLMAGARQALSIGIILMVISEMFAANNGLGFTIVQFQRSFAIPQMWTGILLLGVVGVLLSLIFRAVEHFVLNWYNGLRRAQRGGN
ncbi:Putative ABC iron siderophore transporter, fused permease and ATPase domains [Actinomycetales bacterium JB111]|nr:Putative ABC iron siderophore transporter, fused permease and ATPase domains [Actinomycetales bacterium JB111]